MPPDTHEQVVLQPSVTPAFPIMLLLKMEVPFPLGGILLNKKEAGKQESPGRYEQALEVLGPDRITFTQVQKQPKYLH